MPPGRPPAPVEEAYFHAKRNALSPDRWEQILCGLADLAEGISASGPVRHSDQLRAIEILHRAYGAPVEGGRILNLDLLTDDERFVFSMLWAKCLRR